MDLNQRCNIDKLFRTTGSLPEIANEICKQPNAIQDVKQYYADVMANMTKRLNWFVHNMPLDPTKEAQKLVTNLKTSAKVEVILRAPNDDMYIGHGNTIHDAKIAALEQVIYSYITSDGDGE